MKYSFATAFLVLSFLLAGCSNQPPADSQFSVTPEPGGKPAFTQPTIIVNVQPETTTTGAYPAPANTEATAYPGPQPTVYATSADGRTKTALESYPVALDAAKQSFSPDAQLFAVAPSTIMISNLGGLPVVSGWFYKFKTTESRREYIVQVVDGQLNGTTQAESVKDPTPRELPIDMTQIKIDSNQVLEQFKAYAAEKSIPTDGIIFDLELVNLEGKGGPVWSVVDPNQRLWLYSVSATNGNVVENPHN